MTAIRQAEFLVKDGKYEEAISVVQQEKDKVELGKRARQLQRLSMPKVNALLWSAYDGMGLLSKARKYAHFTYNRNPSMTNTKRYLDLLFKIRDFSEASRVLEQSQRFKSQAFVKWRKIQEAGLDHQQSNSVSLGDVEPSIMSRILTFVMDRKQCFRLNKAWSHNLATHYRIVMRGMKKAALAQIWMSQCVEVKMFNDWGRLQLIHLKNLIVSNCYGINFGLLPHLESVDISSSHL